MTDAEEIARLTRIIKEFDAENHRSIQKIVGLESQVRSFKDIAEYLASAIDAIANRGLR